MKKEIEVINTGIKDIILELEYPKGQTDVWVTRKDFGLKIYQWGILNKYKIPKIEIIEKSINAILIDYSYWKDKLEL